MDVELIHNIQRTGYLYILLSRRFSPNLFWNFDGVFRVFLRLEIFFNSNSMTETQNMGIKVIKVQAEMEKQKTQNVEGTYIGFTQVMNLQPKQNGLNMIICLRNRLAIMIEMILWQRKKRGNTPMVLLQALPLVDK